MTRVRRFVAAGGLGVLAIAGAIPMLASEATAVTETISGGDLTVTVETVDNLADGQVINVTVQGNNGATINQIDANQCLDGELENQWEFSFDGGACAQSPLSPQHEAQKTIGPFPPGSTPSVSFTYVVGTGEQDTTDQFGDVKHLDCRTSCFLNLYIQYSGNPDVQWGTPIAFGGAVVTTTGIGSSTTGTGPATTATSSTTAPASTTTTTAGPGTSTTAVPGSTTVTTAATGATTSTLGTGGGVSPGGGSSGSSGSGSGRLPITGSPAGLLAGAGVALVVAGGALILHRRRVRG